MPVPNWSDGTADDSHSGMKPNGNPEKARNSVTPAEAGAAMIMGRRSVCTDSGAALRRSDDVSAAIGISRLICILGIVFVHGWTGLGGDQMAQQAGSPQDVMRWIVVELFGRSAVPLLSIVSGWLAAASVTRRGYGAFVRGKLRVILLPMLLWNAIAIVVVCGAGAAGLVRTPLPGGPMWLLDNLINLTRAGDINVQMAFMRDLFLCMLAAPLLARLSDRRLAAIMLATAVWMIGAWEVPILLRPSILTFFVLGMLVRRHDLAGRLGALPFWQALLPFLLVVPAKVLLSIRSAALGAYHVHLLAAVDLGLRAAAALLAWRSAMALVGHAIGGRMLGLERYAFFLFASHLIFMWLLGPAIGDHLTGPMGHPSWPAYFLLQPLLALGFAVGLARVIEAVSPAAARALSGGRLARL